MAETFPQILDRILQLKNELQQKYEVTFLKVMFVRLSQIRDESLANQNHASAVAAEKARGQVADYI